MDSYSLKLRERLNIIFTPRYNFDMIVSIKSVIRLKESPSTRFSNVVHLKKLKLLRLNSSLLSLRAFRKLEFSGYPHSILEF